MDPVSFPQANRELGKPKGMTDAECGSLPVFTDGRSCVSCWLLSDAEIEDLIKTRRLWVLVITGAPTQPPIALTARPPFA